MLSLAIACASFVIGLLIGSTRKERNRDDLQSPPEWTCTWEAMKERDEIAGLIGSAIFERIAKTTKQKNSYGTPHISEDEVKCLGEIVLDWAHQIIGQYQGGEPQ